MYQLPMADARPVQAEGREPQTEPERTAQAPAVRETEEHRGACKPHLWHRSRVESAAIMIATTP